MSLYDSLIAMQAQINDLRAQLNNISRVDRPSIDGDSFVHLTGDETVAGVKTFSSIPVLPASDPTTDNQAVRKAFVDGLSLGKIIAVKSAVLTGTQSSSVASGGNVAITDLSISHACEKTTHKILLVGQVGLLATDTQYANAGVAFAVDGTLVNIGDAASSRTRVSASGFMPSTATNASMSHMITFLYGPASISSKTYTLRAVNVSTSSSILYVNRTQIDNDAAGRPRGASSLILMEVSA